MRYFFIRSLIKASASLALGIFVGHQALGEIIPSNRRIAWQDNVGIPGGIPNRTSVYTTLTAIDNTGTADVRGAIQSAIDACPSNQVVKLPSGTFLINGGLIMKTGVTLRGNGSSTVIKSAGATSGLFRIGTSDVTYDAATASTSISGANAGATSINVASTSGISVGSYLVITETNDPSFVSNDGSLEGPAAYVDGWNTGGTRARGQIVEVTSVSGNTVAFAPALYTAYTRAPWATRFTASCKWAGVEDLKTYANNTGTERNFLFKSAAYCWLKNVECDYADGDHVTLDWSYRCEVRHSYFHDAYLHTSGQFDTMIGMRLKTSGTLVVDNILRRLHVSLMLEWGAAGNVIAYNYFDGNFNIGILDGQRWLIGEISANHGAHPQFNLFEGNYARKFSADATWGSSSHTTLFRNYFSGIGTVHPPFSGRGAEDTSTNYELIQTSRAIDLWELQSYYNIIGNVVGDPSLSARGVVRKVVNPASRGYDNPPYCFSYGYVSEASGGGAAQANPAATVLEHGNWDVASRSVVWDSNIPDHSIPDSLFLSTKPSWFGNLTWPPIDPNRPSASVTNIPAGYRYVYGVDPQPTSVGTINQAPIAAISADPSSGAAPLTVSFSSSGSYDPEGKVLSYNWAFGDGTTSTSPNPAKTFQATSNYTARLTVSDGTNSTSTSIGISVVTPGSGLVAAYGFEEGKGTSVADSSGNGNNGAINNALWTGGKTGGGLSFNGTDSLVTVNDSPSLRLGSGLTLEAWVFPTADGGWKPIIFKPVDPTQVGYVLQGSSAPSGIPSLGLTISQSNLFGTNSLQLNTWSHLAGTYDGTTMRLYVNGVLVGSKPQTGSLAGSSQPLTLGGNTVFPNYWQGLIDDVRIYNRAISASEIVTDSKTTVKPLSNGVQPSPPANIRIIYN